MITNRISRFENVHSFFFQCLLLQKVDYTVESPDVARKRQRLISVNENKNELIGLFSKPDTTLEDIHDWIFVSTAGGGWSRGS